MKLFIRTLILLFCLFTFKAPAFATVIVVGISSGYPPYYYEENGKLTGACVDMVNAVARRMDIEVTYKVYPWKRLILNAKKGDVDAIMPLFRTMEREEYLIFNGLELAHETNHFFTADVGSLSYTGNLEDLTSFRIGVVAEYSYGNTFDRFEFPQKVITLDDKHLIEMFMHNRFDIGVGNRYVVRYYADQLGISRTIKFLDPPITEEMLYLGFTRKGNYHDLAQKFGEALQAYKTTIEYRKMSEKYGMTEPH